MGTQFSENIRRNFFIILCSLFSTITLYVLPINLSPKIKHSVKFILIMMYSFTLYINFTNSWEGETIEKIFSNILSMMILIMMVFIVLN